MQPRSDGSARSDRSGGSPCKRLRPSGGYRDSASFQTATLIYDATWWFCEKFFDPRSRTVDQMVQAARSGRQNIAEASRAAAASSQTELRLLNTARASLEELLLDYEDYLRHRHLPQWAPDSPEARAVRAVAARMRQKRDQPDQPDPPDQQYRTLWALYAPWLEHADPAVRANALICLIHQANYLLDRQISALERAFVERGGYSEQLAAARLAHRARRDQPDQPDPADLIPHCPQCGRPMALRTAKTGKHAGYNATSRCAQGPTLGGVARSRVWRADLHPAGEDSLGQALGFRAGSGHATAQRRGGAARGGVARGPRAGRSQAGHSRAESSRNTTANRRRGARRVPDELTSHRPGAAKPASPGTGGVTSPGPRRQSPRQCTGRRRSGGSGRQ